jgi:hypothetical protein
METMILVAGLAVAGLVGIAAAFYFSIRSGNGGYKRNSRVQAARSGRTRADRLPGGGRSGAASADRPVNSRRPANNSQAANADRAANPGSRNYPAEARTGPNSLMDFSDSGQADSPDEAAKAPKPRRRVGFRKGADIDEEMWPTESFGGVTDDQFWDDMAADKPLTTTARSAQQGTQQDAGSRKRPLAAVPAPEARTAGKPAGARGQTETRGRQAWPSGPYPEDQPGAAEQTMVQPVQAAQAAQAAQAGRAAYAALPPVQNPTAPVQSLKAPAPAPAATQHVYSAPIQAAPIQAAPIQAAPIQAAPVHAAPVQAALPQAGPGPAPSGQQPRGGTQRGGNERGGTQPSGKRGRRNASAGASEDPLTSSAFSLRSSGPVDGNSQQAPRRSRDLPRDQYQSRDQGPLSQETRPRSGGWTPPGTAAVRAYGSGPNGSGPGGSGPAFGYNGASPYPYAGQSRGNSAQEPTLPPESAPYGYGRVRDDEYRSGADHGNGPRYAVPGAPADDPRRPNGVRSHARHGDRAVGDPNRPSRPGYQQGGSHQGEPYDGRNEYRR